MTSGRGCGRGSRAWKKIAFPGDFGNVNTYFWIPIVGPLIGAAVGALIYDLGIRNVLIARGAKPDPEMVEEGADVLDTPTPPAHGAANA